MQSEKSKNRVRTTVEFTPEGLRLKNKYLCFGQRSTLTAGLRLFDQLSAEEQQALITSVLLAEQDEKNGSAAATDEAAAARKQPAQQRTGSKRRGRGAAKSA